MTSFTICPGANARNTGDAREWGLCEYFGCSRCKHDAVPYDRGSDISTADMDISVKASGFSLMAGSMCEGRETFDGIWDLYAERVHSNRFAYVTADWTVYMMDLSEFKRFVYAFARVEADSQKNGGAMKIRCRKESKKMLAWLAAAII